MSNVPWVNPILTGPQGPPGAAGAAGATGATGPAGASGGDGARWVRVEPDALASTDTMAGSPSISILWTPVQRTIAEVWLLPCSFLTANDTNHVTFELYTFDSAGGAGGGGLAAAALNTKTIPSGGSGDWTGNVKVELVLDGGAAIIIPAGGAAALVITKVLAGVVVPGFLFGVDLVPL